MFNSIDQYNIYALNKNSLYKIKSKILTLARDWILEKLWLRGSIDRETANLFFILSPIGKAFEASFSV